MLLILYGLNSAIANLCFQAYGAENHRKYSIYLNKGRITVIIFFVSIFGFMFLCETFLLAIQIHPRPAAIAQQYTYGIVVAFLFQAQYDATT